MNSYTPDVWVILEFESEKYGKIRKILAGWYGGYCGSDSWKLSSGNLPEYMEDDFIVFPQSSGSEYLCHKDSERLSGLTGDIFRQLVANFKDKATVKVVEYANLHSTGI